LKQGLYTNDYQLTAAMDVFAQPDSMAIACDENDGSIDYLGDEYPKGTNPAAKFLHI
jgi:hypothetical protein